MNQDGEHLRLLSVFHYVLGGVTAFFGCFPIIYLAVGIAALTGRMEVHGGPPEAFGWLFVAVGATLITLAWGLAAAMVLCGRNLVVRRAYMYCLIVAGVECVLMPIGTVLGVFSIIVLMRPSVRRAFGVATDDGIAEPGVYA
jgi:hypothetical protein